MFTGIVKERGRVAAIEGDADGVRIRIEARQIAEQTAVGDSISINGACLTVTSVGDGTLAFDAVAETLRRTSLGRLRPGSEVNLEPALRAGEPLGGHIVQGHVDGLGRVRSLEPEGEGARLTITAPTELLRYCVEKGSITVDGVSLTVASLTDEDFSVALIPHTLAETTLSALSQGDEVNLEVDVLAKYVERLVAR